MLQFMDFWDTFGSIFGLFGIFAVLIPIFIFIVFIFVFSMVCKGMSRASRVISHGLTIEAPSFVIPEHQRGHVRSDGSQMTTVRLPERCPSCGAAITQEGIDWTGPLEAKCSYCGSTLHATFEPV
ncbi:MAG: hypothetical protein ACTSV3_01970 [Candidatus Thorarchaeota archaeon]|nr:MAG: hypothetical protein DRP09_04830 [Candidatus Thorarchaeota archaeon]RLI59466.1 MAG: hypothetical protein DRO87_02955 [Candidatus Thorarchaeota archaeon]